MEISNPRRRQLAVAPPTLVSGAAFKKGATFHCPSSPKSQPDDPILSISTLPQRSSTCLQDLEAGLLSNNNRITSILGAIDRSLSDLSSFSKDSQDTILAEPEPVPSFMIGIIDHHASENVLDIDSPAPRRKHHTSDSGIGSTETSEASVVNKSSIIVLHSTKPKTDIITAPSTNHIQSGINGDSTVTPPIGASAQHALSEYACRQIQKHIILPILRDEKLKPFHSLVHGLPHRVNRKEITCLRDLEKVILWLAPVSPILSGAVCIARGTCSGLDISIPELAVLENAHLAIHGVFWSLGLMILVRNGLSLENRFFSSAKLRFSAFILPSSILAAAILLDQPIDHTLTDTFSILLNRLDNTQQSCLLKEQGLRPLVNRVSAPQTRTLKKEMLRARTNDIRNEKISLVGGLSQTGRPAELIRSVNGKNVSLRTGEEVNMDDYKTGHKRSFEDYDDDVERSMARRKKNAVPVIQTCKECGKDFKRPCDLTKHEKTHSRPWKCAEVGCKYHNYGWPTEKERDRHMNDKHSAAPKMYRCQYAPCPYESKRESNCKQHMEKAHGYVYLRAKNNGKARAPSTVGVPTTPQLSPGSDVFNAPTPAFSDDLHSVESHEDPNWNFTGMNDMDYMSGATNFAEVFGSTGNEFNFAAPPFDYVQAGPSNFHRPSYDMNSVTPPAEEHSIFGADFNWSDANTDLVNYNAQIPTPALTHKPGFTSSVPSTTMSPPPCLSPTGQGEAMLFSPASRMQHDFHDEGYVDISCNQVPDFDLYINGGSSATISPPIDFFGELPSFDEKNCQQMMDTQMTYFENML